MPVIFTAIALELVSVPETARASAVQCFLVIGELVLRRHWSALGPAALEVLASARSAVLAGS